MTIEHPAPSNIGPGADPRRGDLPSLAEKNREVFRRHLVAGYAHVLLRQGRITEAATSKVLADLESSGLDELRRINGHIDDAISRDVWGDRSSRYGEESSEMLADLIRDDNPSSDAELVARLVRLRGPDLSSFLVAE